MKSILKKVAVNKTIEQADTNPWAAVKVAEWCENNSYPAILSIEDKIPFLEKAVNCSWATFTERCLQDEFNHFAFTNDLLDAYIWSDPIGRAWKILGNYYLQFDDEQLLNRAYHFLTYAGMARCQVRDQLRLYRNKMRSLNKSPNTTWELYPEDRKAEEEDLKKKGAKRRISSFSRIKRKTLKLYKQ